MCMESRLCTITSIRRKSPGLIRACRQLRREAASELENFDTLKVILIQGDLTYFKDIANVLRKCSSCLTHVKTLVVTVDLAIIIISACVTRFWHDIINGELSGLFPVLETLVWPMRYEEADYQYKWFVIDRDSVVRHCFERQQLRIIDG